MHVATLRCRPGPPPTVTEPRRGMMLPVRGWTAHHTITMGLHPGYERHRPALQRAILGARDPRGLGTGAPAGHPGCRTRAQRPRRAEHAGARRRTPWRGSTTVGVSARSGTWGSTLGRLSAAAPRRHLDVGPTVMWSARTWAEGVIEISSVAGAGPRRQPA